MEDGGLRQRRLRRGGRSRLYVPPCIILIAVIAAVIICIHLMTVRPAPDPQPGGTPHTCPASGSSAPKTAVPQQPTSSRAAATGRGPSATRQPKDTP